MENSETILEEQPKTLMQAFERLDEKCIKLKEVARLTEKLTEKLNRTEGHPKSDNDIAKKESSNERNIVELFNMIANEIEIQINVIGENVENSLKMIE